MRREDRARVWTDLLESTKDMNMADYIDREAYESLAARVRVREAHDRWAYWMQQVHEKAARVPVSQEIWDEEVIPLRQPIEECE